MVETASPIPLIDLRAQYQAIKSDIDAAIAAVLARGQFILGPEVEAFEREIAVYCGASHAVAVASGTDALELSLRACGVGPGDEVITTVYSFIAAAEAIIFVGARPVFVDIEPDGYNIDPDGVERAISPRTKAMIPVHLYGHPCAMDRLTASASARGIPLIEDCAQAIGAQWRGARVGGMGRAGCFSFYPTKNLGAYGDAGMIVTNDAQLADSLQWLRAHGSRERYDHQRLGTNSRLDELQAAILRVKLRHLDAWNDARRRHAATYAQAFHRAGLRDLILPQERADCRHVYHLYPVRVAQRERVIQALARQGIATQICYPSTLAVQPALKPWCERGGPFPHAEAVAREILALPLYPELTIEQIERVVRAIAETMDTVN